MSITETTASSAVAAPVYDPCLSSQGALLAAIVRSQCSNRAAATSDVETCYDRLEQLRQEIAEAVAAAREAEEDAGFWGDIADFFGEDLANIAGAIAAAAAIVATGGTGAPLVLAVMAAGLEIGAKVGAELGLDPKIAMAIGLAGAALGLLAGNAGNLGSIQALASDVRAVATTVKGTAVAAGGVSGAIAEDKKSDALEFQAQVSFTRSLEDEVTLDIDDAIAALEQALSRQTRATSVASSVTRADEIADRNVTANIGGSR
jgi:hypothetical protein